MAPQGSSMQSSRTSSMSRRVWMARPSFPVKKPKKAAAGGADGGGTVGAWWINGCKRKLRALQSVLPALLNVGDRVYGIHITSFVQCQRGKRYGGWIRHPTSRIPQGTPELDCCF